MTWKHNVQAGDEEQRKYVHQLGYALLNCGNLEMLTYTYAATLTGRDIFDTGLTGMFARRRKRIEVLLAEADLPDELRARALDLWGETSQVMQWRNLIAHSPITAMDIKRSDGKHEPHLTVIDMANTKSRADVKHLTVDQLAKIVNTAQKLAQTLSHCLREIATGIASGQK